MKIRKMNQSDLDFAVECTKAEGWQSETRSVFQAFYQHEHSGCFIAEANNKRLGLCIATSYEKSGFLGELVVIPEARGFLVGPQLLSCSITYLKNKGIKEIYLDGEIAASTYYEHIGFRKICRSLRFIGTFNPVHHLHIRHMKKTDLHKVFQLDKKAFNDDRSFFLEKIWTINKRLCKVMETDGEITGYVMAKPGLHVIAVGPLVTDKNINRPLDLLESLSQETGSTPLRLGVLESNSKALEWIRGVDTVKEQQYCWRMIMGKSENLGMSPMCITIGSAAKG